jgi:hypothetical protein
MSARTAALTRKEVRALLPIWAASAGTIVADPFVRGTSLHSVFPVGMLAYIIGSLALGAHAIGHEHSNRTLGTLFAQPVRRSAILWTKATVLALMLLGLAMLAWPLLFLAQSRIFADLPRYPTLLLPVVGGLFVAPLITMTLRSQMAGVIFTGSIPGTIYVVALLAGVTVYGVRTSAADAFALAVWTPAVYALGAASAVLSARTFMRLQDIDGQRAELRLPRWLAATDRDPVRPPLWTLVKKELRLQQMTFAMPLLMGGIWMALTIVGRLNPQFGKDFPILGVAVLYFALLPLLMGSLASAQERQFGTLESQAMLPVPFAHQWAIKAGVVLVLALVLGVLLPWFVLAPPQVPRETVWSAAVVILLLTCWSLYLSSWSPSGIVALALIVPATAAALVATRWVHSIVESVLYSGHSVGVVPPVMLVPQAVMGAPLGVLLVVFAGHNHRRPDRSVAQLARQGAWLLAVFAATDILVSTFL